MADKSPIRYGTINFDMIGGWFGLAPEDDPPFWAVNLMKYREVAEYADGREATVSGKEADDVYSPLGPLAAIGAVVALHGDVIDQPSGEPAWDRIGIVRYPSRAGFFAMQERDDFKEAHHHKDAGMEATIVIASAPGADAPLGTDLPDGGVMVMRVRRFTDGTRPDEAPVAGVTPIARLDVEGVIVGDDRTWHEIAFDAAADADAVTALCASTTSVEECIAVTMQPTIDRLVDSIESAPTPGA